MEYFTKFISPKPLIVKSKKDLSDNNVYVFDTEVSSLFKIDGVWQSFDYSKTPKEYRSIEKAGVLYLWGFSANEKTYYGRTLSDFLELLQELSDPNIRKIVYVHNLSYDFQFLLNIITDFDVFARKAYHPIKAYSPSLNIEFRCSYFLTNSKLEYLAKNYSLPVKKLVGNLDYNKARHSKTYLDKNELEYLENDLLVVYYFIKQVMLPLYKVVPKIPLTQTGRVRQEVKSLFKGDRKHFEKMKTLQPQSVNHFRRLRQAFAGGWTHANVFHANQILDNVFSFDRASSYPSVMIMEKFPMTPFRECSLPLEMINFSQKAALIEITFYDLQTTKYNTYLSLSKATSFDRVKTDNGRVISANIISFTLTDVDYEIVCKCYKWRKKVVNHLEVSQKAYLPQKYIDYVCKLYKDKTELKNIPDQEATYARVKEYINSLYGMCVTNTIKDECMLMNGEWITEPLSVSQIATKLEEQNKKSNFLSYAFGVWITAYARAELWKIISEVDEDVVYCDTDSIKFINEENIEVFDKYNADYIDRLHNRGIEWDFLAPKDKKGNRHPIGIFEQEKTAYKFITLGAKKYCCKYKHFVKISFPEDVKEGIRFSKKYKGQKFSYKMYKPYYWNYFRYELKITVSGVPKKGAKQLSDIEDFKTGFVFDYTTGKVLSYYHNEQCANGAIRFKDYNGLEGVCEDNYGICLMPTTYSLGMSVTYEDLILALSEQASNRPTAIDKSGATEVMLVYFNQQ